MPVFLPGRKTRKELILESVEVELTPYEYLEELLVVFVGEVESLVRTAVAFHRPGNPVRLLYALRGIVELRDEFETAPVGRLQKTGEREQAVDVLL